MSSSPISSRHNPRVKAAVALRNRRQRLERGETIVYGARESLRALACGARVHTALLCPDLYPHAEAAEAAGRLAEAGETLTVTAEVFQRLAYGDRQDGVACVVATPERPLSAISVEAQAPLIAVIEGVEKPGNLGALLRTADGAGVDAVMVADPVIDLFNPNAIRASVGMTFMPNLAVAPAGDCLAWLQQRNMAVLAARPDAADPYWGTDMTGPVALVFGAEAAGLTDLWAPPAVTPVALPMLGVGDSLNVSASAAVLLYEARRQRATAG